MRRTVQNDVTAATIPMTEQDYEEYYLGFANTGSMARLSLPAGFG